MLIATVRVVVPESRRAEVLQALRLLRGPTAARMGCDSFHLYRDDEDENALLLLQQWASKADLERYLQSELYSTILAVIETAIEPPDIRFDTVVSTAGIDLVMAVRQGHCTLSTERHREPGEAQPGRDRAREHDSGPEPQAGDFGHPPHDRAVGTTWETEVQRRRKADQGT